MMPSNPRLGGPPIRTLAAAAMNACPRTLSDEQGPWGRNVEPVACLRNAVREAGFATPVISTGGIYSFEQAESLLAEGKADVVGFARQALADPDWFEKVRRGHGAEVMLCRYSNYCEGLDQKHKQVTCELWDRTGLDEADVVLASDRKRRLLAPPWAPDKASI